jgi:hypothetical protein
LLRGGIAVAVLILAIQAVPYGWRHPNPPVSVEAPWPSERAESIARAACYDCHSNETIWPAYSYVAPMSWLVRQDVEAGRDELNFSEWDSSHRDAEDAAESIADESMPPRRYELLHGDARLSESERAELVAALEAMERREDSSGRGS